MKKWAWEVPPFKYIQKYFSEPSDMNSLLEVRTRQQSIFLQKKINKNIHSNNFTGDDDWCSNWYGKFANAHDEDMSWLKTPLLD